MSEYLTDYDLKKVRNYLWEVCTKWFDIGIELNLKPAQLEVIKCDHAGNVQDCYTQMLIQWLSQIDPLPTWYALVDALKSPAIGGVRIYSRENNSRTKYYHANKFTR